MTTNVHQRQKGRGSHWQDYVPLIVIIALTLMSACAKQLAYGSWNWMSWMLGVIRALSKRLDIECACLGTVLKVPLSTVALVEDLGMAAMAAGMLISGSTAL